MRGQGGRMERWEPHEGCSLLWALHTGGEKLVGIVHRHLALGVYAVCFFFSTHIHASH